MWEKACVAVVDPKGLTFQEQSWSPDNDARFRLCRASGGWAAWMIGALLVGWVLFSNRVTIVAAKSPSVDKTLNDSRSVVFWVR